MTSWRGWSRYALLGAAVLLALWLGVFGPRGGAGSDDKVRDVIAAVPGAPHSAGLPSLSQDEERMRFAVVAVAAAIVFGVFIGRSRA
ncbi:hypothetical protein [Gemmatimonas sp.]|uniref:hypothetical protein n=1 Tax=Gemmatimonas sp. TaxID=1962908 RepID=UPI0025C597BA|nr:hypothetical protein [Gemmatimonas sp.]MCA2995819.1 hypothetical protein [Gemmatimonas sp.]